MHHRTLAAEGRRLVDRGLDRAAAGARGHLEHRAVVVRQHAGQCGYGDGERASRHCLVIDVDEPRRARAAVERNRVVDREVLPTATMSGTSYPVSTTAAPVAPLRLAMTLSIRKTGPMVPMEIAVSEVVSAIRLPWNVNSAPLAQVFGMMKNCLEPMEVL